MAKKIHEVIYRFRETGSERVARQFSRLQKAFFAQRAASHIKNFGHQISRINDDLIKYENTIKAVNKTNAEAADQWEFVVKEAQFLGLEIGAMAEAWGKLRASADAAGVSLNTTKAVFQGFSEATRVLNLSTDDLHGVFKAVIQMFSKGRIQAEELRGQLGDRLVGAFQMTAKAMGITVAELEDLMKAGKLTAEDVIPKLSEQLRKTFGRGLPAAINTSQAAMTRLRNEFELFLRDMRPLIEGTKKFVAGAGVILIQWLRIIKSTVVGAIKLVADTWNGGWRIILENTRKDFSNHWKLLVHNVKVGVRNMLLALAGFDISGSFDSLANYWTDTWDKIFDNTLIMLRNFWKKLKNELKSGVHSIFTFLGRFADDTGGFVAAFFENFKNAAANINISEPDLEQLNVIDRIQNKFQEMAEGIDVTPPVLEEIDNVLVMLQKASPGFEEEANKIELAFKKILGVLGLGPMPGGGAAGRKEHKPDVDPAAQANKWRTALEDLFLATEDGAKKAQDMIEDWMDASTDAIVDFVKTGKLEFSSLIESIITDIAKLAIKQAIVAPLFGAIFGQASVPGASVQAKGNAFSRGNVVPFRRGGVVGGPTIFPMANGGIGLMGEEGPEAIMPLTRTRGGKLGVQSDGANKVVVNVYNQGSGSEVEVKTSPDGRTIDLLITDIVKSGIGSGQFDRSLQANFGLNRRGR